MVILGSARELSRGKPVAHWVVSELKKMSHEVDFVNLKELNLPFYDEPTSPFSYGKDGKEYTNPKGREWADRVCKADAYIFVHAEYNHSVPAILKNALDWVGTEWAGKRSASVSYAYGSSGGIRAVEHIRQIVIELSLAPSAYAVHIPRVEEAFDDNQQPVNQGLNEALQKVITDLKK